MLQAWPKIASFTIALIPVGVLVFMVATILVRAWPAITDIGVGELFSTKFSSRFLSGVGHYGLVPAIWGTMELLVIAMTLAVPASLAMAVYSGELASGFVGQLLRWALALLAGIPPIVYALMAIVFVAPFMIPKFTGGLSYSNLDSTKVGVAPSNWPPPGVPWNAGAFAWNPTGENSSVLLAGILLAMLAIPFMAPLIDDAIRNVPVEPKEASLALGASTWYTLIHITLPRALVGIIGAVRLGALKALGDVMIGLFVVGFAAVAMPFPAWDVLERTAPLTSEGAGLIGGFYGPGACNPADCSAGYFTGLLLLLMALAVVIITLAAERWVKRKVAV
jgi:phosphate transport system permease protein